MAQGRRYVWCGLLGLRCGGLRGSFGPMGQLGVHGLPSRGACVLVPCPLGVLAPQGVPGSVGRGVVASSGASGPLRSCFSAFLPSCILGAAAVSPSSSGACAVACVVALAVAGRGLAVRVWWWAARCSRRFPYGWKPFSPCGCTLLPLCGVRWPVGATRCGSCGVWWVLRRRGLTGVRPWGSSCVDSGWGGAGLSVVACPSCVRALVPVVAPSPLVPRPLAFPFPGLLLVSCRRVALTPVPCPCGCLPATSGPCSLPCHGPSLCPCASWSRSGVVVAEPVGRWWPMPGGEWSGARCRGV